MNSTDTFQGELEDWQARFYSFVGYPRKSVTITLPSHRLVVQYERKGVPSVYGMRQTARERIYETVSGTPDIFVGRSLRGRALSRFYLGRSIEIQFPLGWAVIKIASLVFGALTGDSRKERRARTFAEGLLEHWQAFEPVSPPPEGTEGVTVVTSSDRRITIVYDPELDSASIPAYPFFVDPLWYEYNRRQGRV